LKDGITATQCKLYNLRGSWKREEFGKASTKGVSLLVIDILLVRVLAWKIMNMVRRFCLQRCDGPDSFQHHECLDFCTIAQAQRKGGRIDL
jgi:hypothetical protein